MCYSLLVLKKDVLFIIKTVSNKNCFFSGLEGYIHILDDEEEFGVTKKNFILIQHLHKIASHAVLSRGVVILPLRNKK